MSQTNLFAKLGAPLANPRWSWGAIRTTDGAVFSRVWQDSRTGVRLARTGTGVRLGICTLFVAWASRKAAVRGSFFHFETVLS